MLGAEGPGASTVGSKLACPHPSSQASVQPGYEDVQTKISPEALELLGLAANP